MSEQPKFEGWPQPIYAVRTVGYPDEGISLVREVPDTWLEQADPKLDCEAYRPVSHSDVLREALESIQGNAYLWQIGEGPWADAEALIEDIRREARSALEQWTYPPSKFAKTCPRCCGELMVSPTDTCPECEGTGTDPTDASSSDAPARENLPRERKRPKRRPA